MGLDAPTVHLGFPKVGGAKDNDFNEQKTCLQTWDFNEDPESLQHFFRLHRLFSYNIFFFALSCLIAEVQPDFQSYLIIQIVGIHRSSPLVIGGMMIKYGRDIKSQRILTGNRSIDEVSTII